MRISSLARVLLEREEGQDGAEYALLVGFIAVIIIAGVGAFGASLLQHFNGLVLTLQAFL
jgi:pilus assembly protein Flp/PilA